MNLVAYNMRCICFVEAIVIVLLHIVYKSYNENYDNEQKMIIIQY